MDWVENFQLFLFDMDGLLVNTEKLHYLAYQKMCEQRGVRMDWTFGKYCQIAHYDSKLLRKRLCEDFPALLDEEWDVLYADKQKNIVELMNNGSVQLMPGVQQLLTALAERQIKRCVVTHSADELVQVIRKQNPLLDTIPNWITRHDYAQAKPNPECYLKAIKKLAAPGDRIIGFEDTPRGLTALLQTPATAVFITEIDYPETSQFVSQGAQHFKSLSSCLDHSTR